jgi:hypothetical protein
MRAPPPVQVRCHAGPRWRVFQAFIPGLSGAVVVFRLGLHGLALGTNVSPALWLLSGAAGLLIAGLVWRLTVPVTAELHWTGTAWALQGRPLKSVHVRFDMGHWMLMECQGTSGVAQWQVACKAVNRSQWALWRAAVYCSGPGLHPKLES